MFGLKNVPGAKINILQDLIDDEHQDVLWYGGRVAEVEYNGYTFILGAYGDVYCTLLDGEENEIAEVRDKNNAGEFYGVMRSYLVGDTALYKAKNLQLEDRDPYLEIESNNWWEVLIDGPDGTQHDLGWVCNDDDYIEALNEMLVNMDDVIKEIEEY